MSNVIQEHWAGWIESFNLTQVPEHQLFALSPSLKDESKVQAGSKKVSKHHAYFQVDKYGDLQFSEGYMKLARFSVSDAGQVLVLQIGAHEETATLKMSAENNASPSSCSHDVGVSEGVTISTPYYSARIQDLMVLKSSTKYVTAPNVEFDIEASKPTWTQLAHNEDANEVASDEDDWSDNDGDGSNLEEFNRLKEHPKWGPFFRNNRYSDLKLGALIGQGGQAKVYEAIDGRDSKKRTLVVKVFEKGFQLCKLQKWWPKGLVEAANSHRHVFNVRYVCWALGAQLLEDDRFAFVFPKLNCDLRKRIDDAMRKRNGIGPPFSPFTCFCIISDIAAGMAYLHNRNMMHHDLKAANVLDLRNVSEDQMCIMMLIADFESSAGTWGTGFWRAPEILRQIIERERAASAGEKRKKLKFTKEADVYSFAMTCYEVITGRLPYEGCSASVDGIIDRGERPDLPRDICPGLRDLICQCWHSDPLQRPSFNTIRSDLIEIGKTESKAWNIYVRYKQVLSHLSNSEIFDSKEETKGVKDINWEWPIYDQKLIHGMVQRQLRETDIPYYIIFETENGIIKRLPPGERDNDKPDMTPFEVTYDHTISVEFKDDWDFTLDHHSRSMLDNVTIKVKSHNLIQVVNQCLPNAQAESFCMENPTIDANDMFIALKAFKDALLAIQQDLDHESKAQYWELKHLLRFLETHYKDTTARIERMRQEKKVSFDLLWAFFFKGERVHYTCNMTGRTLHGILALAYYKDGQKTKFKVKLDCRDYDGWEYVKRFVKFRVEEFKGEESFDSIGMGPMRFLENSRAAEMDAMFLRNGRKFFYTVAHGSTYMQYVGPRIFRKGGTGKIMKQKADGRVMVDLLSFARTNPNFPLNNAKPPTDRTDHQTVPFRNEQETPSDEELMLAPAVVYGFSFSNKRWGGFDINGLSEVHFDDQAFDQDLVLTDPDKKEMLLALVIEYLKDPSADDCMAPKIDPISNKGDGCIFLCYGPPGTGKTLTAESIAEKLHRPLWSMSVFELGMEAEDLEEELTEILDIALQWRAVLLLDEADVYLEKPTSNGNPNRAAMTAIFLRLLEYYRGVLFLTTNRVASLDDAILSRVSIFLRYHRISVAQGEAIWRSLLARAQILNPDLSLFSSYSLNGREIRICIRSAQVLARSSGEELTTDHVLRAVSMLVELRRNLEDAVKEETDEQSITGVLRRIDSIAESTLTSALSAYSTDS